MSFEWAAQLKTQNLQLTTYNSLVPVTIINVGKVPIKTLNLSPGSRVLLAEVTWQHYEALLEDLGEKRGSRLAYNRGMLEVRVPLPEHERGAIALV